MIWSGMCHFFLDASSSKVFTLKINFRIVCRIRSCNYMASTNAFWAMISLGSLTSLNHDISMLRFVRNCARHQKRFTSVNQALSYLPIKPSGMQVFNPALNKSISKRVMMPEKNGPTTSLFVCHTAESNHNNSLSLFYATSVTMK